MTCFVSHPAGTEAGPTVNDAYVWSIHGLGRAGLCAGPSHVAVAGLLCGVGHGFGFPILSGIIVDRAPDEDRGSAITFFTALFDLGVLVGGPILGVIITGLGYSAMFNFSALFIVGTTVLFWIWDDRRLRALPEVALSAAD